MDAEGPLIGPQPGTLIDLKLRESPLDGGIALGLAVSTAFPQLAPGYFF